MTRYYLPSETSLFVFWCFPSVPVFLHPYAEVLSSHHSWPLPRPQHHHGAPSSDAKAPALLPALGLPASLQPRWQLLSVLNRQRETAAFLGDGQTPAAVELWHTADPHSL